VLLPQTNKNNIPIETPFSGTGFVRLNLLMICFAPVFVDWPPNGGALIVTVP
jgi:hypothetical protein